MNQYVYNTFLVSHIVGITIMAGATFIDFVTFNQFWKVYAGDKPQGLVLGNMTLKLQRFMGIGMLLIILSGVGMMYYLHQVWGQQLWFRVKMIILLLIIVNGLGLRRMVGSRLKRILSGDCQQFSEQLSGLRGKVLAIHYFQFVFFVIIFFLSVFKFN
jgi:hypothetical protein